MNSALATLLIYSLFCFYAQGQPVNRSSRCLCKNGFIQTPARLGPLLKDCRVFYPSSFCPQVEITIKTKKGTYCVDPKSHAGKYVLTRKLQNVRSTSVTAGLPLSSTQDRRQTTAQL
ncbi:C-X-C motif chemokine 11-like [Nelusetta ayraudi]|uniref:C-X-C motif chemokine 11-like n=1 Tax=Nelusetta ayraudi TaxID=303726 RepID=UPI003F710C2F